MGIDEVRRYFADNGVDREIIEFQESSATVDLAAKALGVQPEVIAKTLALWAGDRPIVVVTRGDARLDNRKFKDHFKAKPKMLGATEVEEMVGHPVGGVCPFATRTPLDIYLDVSLQKFEIVFPAAGGANTAVPMTPDELLRITGAGWVDVCRLP